MKTFRDHAADAWLRFRFRMLYPRARYTEAGARFALAGTRPLNRALRRMNRELRRTARVMAAFGCAMAGPSASARCFNVRLPLALAVAALSFSACDQPQRMQLRVEEPVVAEAGAPGWRFEVSRVGTFADDLAYGGVRGVYLIRDRETGAELGVSGIGISELGLHGKGVRDER